MSNCLSKRPTQFSHGLKHYSPQPIFHIPKEVLEKDTEILRSCGISYAKISYIAETFQADKIAISVVKKLSDEYVITELTKIKGIGR